MDDATLWQQGAHTVGGTNLPHLPNIIGNSNCRIGTQAGIFPGFTGATGTPTAQTTATYVTSLKGSSTDMNVIGYFNASRSSPTYGRYGDNNNSVVPRSINVLFCIKY